MYNFMINPAARSGMGRKTWKKVEKILLEQQIEYRAYYTKGQGDARRIAGKVTSGSDPVKLVLIGGDGTLHEMVSGIKTGKMYRLVIFRSDREMILQEEWDGRDRRRDR